MTNDYASDFADFGGVTYLNIAFQGPMPRVAAAAAEEALQLKKTPYLISDGDYFSYPDAYRSAVADLIGCDAADVAVTDSATHGVMLLVGGLDWQAGDEVVLPRGEFPANRFPWLSLERRGVKVREVPVGPGLSGLQRLAAAITPRTRAVAASWVAYSTGLRLEIEALARICRDRGVLFVLDGTQGVGGLDFRLSEVPCDLLVCAGYKWLLGPYGLGFAYVEPELGKRLELSNVNWFAVRGARDFNRLSECELAYVPGAARFDMNEAASFTNVAAGVASLRYLERVGVATVEHHVASLLEGLVAGLPVGFRDAGASGTERRSNILCISGPNPERTERAADALAAARVFTSRREGTIRISPHLFNTADEIDRVLEILHGSGESASVAVGSALFGLAVGDPVVTPGPAALPRPRSLEGRWVTLRPIDAERDVDDLYSGSHGSPEREALWTYMAYGPFGSREQMRRQLEELGHSRDALFFAVVDNASSQAVGMACLQRVVPRNRCIEIAHVWYVPERQRSRVNTETIYLLLREVFDHLGYRRVEWKCDALNRRSRTAALRLGFRFEGIFRQHMIIKDRNRDTAWFAMVDGDWRPAKEDIERWLYSDEELSLTRLTQRRRLASPTEGALA
ncbi:MAG: aminotransferase class V-fold PLP-dependent enzyme [bacterium]|nr:aminotransferase class V-fold PLP-dependent enzyme [bacterium]